MAISSKVCKPNNIDFIGSEAFLKSNSPNIFALCETNLEDSTDFSNLSVRNYLPLIQKDFVNHMHGLTVYVNEELPFTHDLSLENQLVLPCLVPYFLFLNR